MNDKKFSVAVIGNVGIDTNVYFNYSEPDFSVESNFTENIDYVGQAGGFSSRILAQLGFSTAFIGYIGEDFNGRFIKEEFARDGIDMSATMIDPAGTSRSINFMFKDGRRKNFYDGKSHLNLKPDLNLCHGVLESARAAYFHIPDWARNLLPIAKKLKIPIICDIQDVTDPTDHYRRDFIESADYLFFSSVNH
ncbi:MAG: carbohydrate kinase family protein, partial [Candidatus Riflebacteria bacterium]